MKKLKIPGLELGCVCGGLVQGFSTTTLCMFPCCHFFQLKTVLAHISSVWKFTYVDQAETQKHE